MFCIQYLSLITSFASFGWIFLTNRNMFTVKTYLFPDETLHFSTGCLSGYLFCSTRKKQSWCWMWPADISILSLLLMKQMKPQLLPHLQQWKLARKMKQNCTNFPSEARHFFLYQYLEMNNGHWSYNRSLYLDEVKL